MLGKPEIAQQLNRALREDLQASRAAVDILAGLIATLRLAVAHVNPAGAGLVAAVILGENAPRWRELPAEIRAYVEQRECFQEPAFLQKILTRPWLREGPSAALQVLASRFGGADIEAGG